MRCLTPPVHLWMLSSLRLHGGSVLQDVFCHHPMQDQYLPIRLEKFDLPIRHVACGGDHCLAVNYNGDLFSWGKNESGQLGLGEIGRKAPSLVRQDRRLCFSQPKGRRM